jgi:hypothetical protein
MTTTTISDRNAKNLEKIKSRLLEVEPKCNTPFELLCHFVSDPFYRIASLILFEKWNKARKEAFNREDELRNYMIFVSCNIVFKMCADNYTGQSRYIIQLLLHTIRKYNKSIAQHSLAYYEAQIAQQWRWRLYQPLEQAHSLYLRQQQKHQQQTEK